MDTARNELKLIYCVFVNDELTCVFSNEAKAQAYIERLYDDGVDGYYTSIVTRRKLVLDFS